MYPKEPQDDEKLIHHPETEIPVDHQITADKIGSQAVSGANRDGSDLINEYQKRIDKILSAPLTPETFEGYAEDALNDVIKVADDMIAQYLHQRGLNGMPVNSLVEDSIAGNYEISIDSILDDLKHKADDIKKIQKSVEEISKDSRVYVPPDSEDIKITDGLVEFETADTAPKVETILFMLQENYGLEIDNPKDIILISGTVSREMMRNEPYVLIDIPSLNRIILACNEKGNITYVFDQEKIKEADIPLDKLVDYTKKQLNEIIKDFESIGIRIIHTAKYLPKIEEALSSIKHFAKTGEKAIEENPDIKDPDLLAVDTKDNRLPQGYRSLKKSAKILGTSTERLKKIAVELRDELGDEFGDILEKKLANGNVGILLSTAQIEIIAKSEIIKKAPPSKKGIESVASLARKLDVSSQLVKKIKEQLSDELGDVHFYRFRTVVTEGFSPAQQEIITVEIGKIKSVPLPKDGYLPIKGVAKKFGVDKSTIQSIEEKLVDELGTIGEYRFSNNITRGFSPAQQELIGEEVAKFKSTPIAAEGEKSVSGIARQYGLAERTVQTVVDRIEKELGTTEKRRFNNKTGTSYSAKQVAIIVENLPLAPKPPNGTRSVQMTSSELKADPDTIKKIMAEKADTIGETPEYKFGGQIVSGISPEQFEIIKNELEKRRNKK